MSRKGAVQCTSSIVCHCLPGILCSMPSHVKPATNGGHINHGGRQGVRAAQHAPAHACCARGQLGSLWASPAVRTSPQCATFGKHQEGTCSPAQVTRMCSPPKLSTAAVPLDQYVQPNSSPAQVTRMCSPPKLSTAAATSLAGSSGSVTSPATLIAEPQLLRMKSAVACWRTRHGMQHTSGASSHRGAVPNSPKRLADHSPHSC